MQQKPRQRQVRTAPKAAASWVYESGLWRLSCGKRDTADPRPSSKLKRDSRVMSDLESRAVLTVLRSVPPGAERDVVIGLVKLGATFKCQHVGRRPGALAELVLKLMESAGAPYTFKRLVLEMEYEAVKRSRGFPSQIEEVDKEAMTVAVELPGRGIVERKFSAVRRHYYEAKKFLQ